MSNDVVTMGVAREGGRSKTDNVRLEAAALGDRG